jgi:hypothetical protein
MRLIMRRRIKFAALLIAVHISVVVLGNKTDNTDIFNEITLQIDTLNFTRSLNSISIQNEKYIYFQYHADDEICHVKLFPNANHPLKNVVLEESGDYDVIDSLTLFNNLYYDFKIQFKRITKSEFLKFRLLCTIDSIKTYYDINLFPVTHTLVKLNQNSDDLVVGEDKVFELISNNIGNIKYEPDWDNSQDISYRIIQSSNQLFVHLNGNSVGKKNVSIHVSLHKPFMQNGKPVYDLPPLNYTFNVKSAGLAYLQTDKPEITLDEKAKNEGVTLQFDNGRLLQLKKTYIIEAQEAPGSPLIATLYTRERLANNKILTVLHIFNYHRQTEGYLYIKDNDEAKFLTNLNITPKTTIERIKIMRNGKDWTEDSNVYPGETVNLRLEGQSLNKSKFNFDALIELANDSVIKNESFIEYKLKVPLNISKKTINIFNYNQNTGRTLTVKEYQNARPFDYVNLTFGDRTKTVSDFQAPELYDKSVKDIIISFKPEKIDNDGNICGKQYLDIDVKVYNDKGELTDFANINDVAICPGDNSPRNGFYDKSDCSNSEISLNTRLNGYIYNLKDWSKLKITFKNQKDKYTKDLQSKTVEIILQKHYSFDVDVSFPAGLLIKKVNESGFGNFGGVSLAVLAQFSFYDNDKIAKFKPYKLGAGFIALNAFDFSQQSSNRDMGIVILGTLYPVNSTRKLSFPIYLGGGYLMSQKKLFWLLGPGISVQF